MYINYRLTTYIKTKEGFIMEGLKFVLQVLDHLEEEVSKIWYKPEYREGYLQGISSARTIIQKVIEDEEAKNNG